MKILFAILLVVFTTACSSFVTSATPTPPPPSAPAVPSTAAPTPQTPLSNTALNVKDVNQTKQANEITKSASITTGPNLGIGQIELSYPDTMIDGESRAVRLRLSPAQQLVTSRREPAKTRVPNSPDFVLKFSGNVDLYPVMNAELIALGFDVSPAGRIRQAVDTASPANWSWVVKAKSPGKQELALTISIPAVVDGSNSELTKNLQDLAMSITVSPAPVSLTDQILNSIANNSGAIIVALIGLLGTLIGIVVKIRMDRAAAKPKS